MLQTFWGIRVWKLICICNWTPQNVSNYVYSLQTMIFLISSWPWLLTNKLILQTLPTYITSWEDFKLLSSKSSFCYRPILLGSRIMFLFFPCYCYDFVVTTLLFGLVYINMNLSVLQDLIEDLLFNGLHLNLVCYRLILV